LGFARHEFLCPPAVVGTASGVGSQSASAAPLGDRPRVSDNPHHVTPIQPTVPVYKRLFSHTTSTSATTIGTNTPPDYSIPPPTYDLRTGLGTPTKGPILSTKRPSLPSFCRFSTTNPGFHAEMVPVYTVVFSAVVTGGGNRLNCHPVVLETGPTLPACGNSPVPPALFLNQSPLRPTNQHSGPIDSLMVTNGPYGADHQPSCAFL